MEDEGIFIKNISHVNYVLISEQRVNITPNFTKSYWIWCLFEERTSGNHFIFYH